MSTHKLCFEQKYEKYHNFLSENFRFLDMKFFIYLNRRVFVMEDKMNRNIHSQNIHHNLFITLLLGSIT